MTSVMLLESLKTRTEAATAELFLPVKPTKQEQEPDIRVPAVYKTRLPDEKASNKYAPYVLHTVVNTSFRKERGNPPEDLVNVRTLFCVYSADEQEGGLNLLNLMERLRIALLQQHIIGKKYELNLQEGVETLIYPDDTAPYFMGEMVTVWNLPPVQREVSFI